MKFARSIIASALVAIGAGALIAPAVSEPKDRLNDACWDTTFFEPFDELRIAKSPNSDNGKGWATQYIWDRDTIINNELQYYVDPLNHPINPFSVSDGILTISATRTPTNLLSTTNSQEYISGVLTSRNWFEQKYGRFEVRAQVPKGQGLWSAFWMLPTHAQWPQGIAVLPELDVMEHLGHQTGTFHTTLHSNQTGKLTSHPYDHNRLGDLTQGFHTYSTVWTDKDVSWYLDGKLKATHPTPKDFDNPKHFLLNLAVGGSWPGNPDSQTRFPAKYKVDFVRAMEPSGDCS